MEHTIWQTNHATHPRVVNAMASWGHLNPGAKHVVLDDDSMDDFMRNNYDNRTKKASLRR